MLFFLKLLSAPLIITLTGALVGYSTSLLSGLITCVIGLFGWVLYQNFQKILFLDWIKRPNEDGNFPRFGTWQSIYSSVGQFLTTAKTRENQLSKNLFSFKRATEALEDGVIILDKLNQLIFATPRAERYLGIDLERDKGKSIVNMIRNPNFAAFIKIGKVNDTVLIEDINFIKKAMEFKLAPYDENEKLLICRDVTKLRKLERERENFVASASHELKTPLTVILGYLETLTELNPERKEALDMIEEMSSQAKRMSKLINELLVFSRLEQTQPLNEKKIINIENLLSDLLKLSENVTKGSRKITTDLQPFLTLLGWEEHIRSAFWNLIHNAINYTGKNGNISISWQETKTGGAIFEVSDNGIGIESHHIDKLTERFYRVDSDRSRATGGTGLGLSIVNEIVREHNGALEIVSQPRKGSSFKIIFPASTIIKPIKIDHGS